MACLEGSGGGAASDERAASLGHKGAWSPHLGQRVSIRSRFRAASRTEESPFFPHVSRTRLHIGRGLQTKLRKLELAIPGGAIG